MVAIVSALFAAGLLLGFIGAGGSGFIIAILTTGFGYPIHTVLGTALLTMLLSSATGAISHYREGNTHLIAGLSVGAAGAIGAYCGSLLSSLVPDNLLQVLTAAMLILSGVALWLRIRIVGHAKNAGAAAREPIGRQDKAFWLRAIGIGVLTGILSGLFGIGATPFIQLGLMMFLGLPVRIAAGTSMLVIIPIALGGGAGHYALGHIDMQLFIQVAASVMLGSYIGAKFTRRASPPFLQTAMVLFPMVGGAILLI